MDTQNKIQAIRTRFAHEQSRRLLREKYEARMIFAHAGGMWRAGPELILVLQACPDDSAGILDLYETPVQVAVQELKTMCQDRWQEQMNSWLIEHSEISRQR